MHELFTCPHLFDMRHPELPVFAFSAAVLVLIPLPWHWRARNIVTLAIIFWLFIVDVIYGINSIIWAGNVTNSAPMWCDISTKLVVGASFALPLTMLCLCKHLELVSSSRRVSYDRRDRQQRMIFECIMCLGLPLVFMTLHFIVQGHRFDIFEDVGCQAALYISVPAIMIIWLPQLFFSVTALIYAAMALHHFMHRRLTFTAHLQNSNSALTTNRYLRLIAMAITEIIWGAAFTTFNLYNNVAPGLRPWTTWADVHSNFSRVEQYPRVLIPPQFLRTMMVFWWVMPASSIIFFVFFGFGEDARTEYVKLWTWLKTKVFKRAAKRSPPSKILIKGSSPVLQLHLVDLKNSTDNHKLPLNTSTTFTWSPSVPTLAASPPRKREEAEFDTLTTCSSSSYDQYMGSPSATAVSHPISISDNPKVTHSFTPIASCPPFPESVNEATDLVFPSTSPTYYRPFGPPSIYPVSELHHSSHSLTTQGIHITIHRQESVDHIV